MAFPGPKPERPLRQPFQPERDTFEHLGRGVINVEPGRRPVKASHSICIGSATFHARQHFTIRYTIASFRSPGTSAAVCTLGSPPSEP